MKRILSAILLLFTLTVFGQGPVLRQAFTTNTATVVTNIVAALGGAQTPWATTINGAQHSLTNAGTVQATNFVGSGSASGTLTLSNAAGTTATAILGQNDSLRLTNTATTALLLFTNGTVYSASQTNTGNIQSATFNGGGAALTNIATTNIVHTYHTFPSATNTLQLLNNYQLLTTATDCSITNVSGGIATEGRWATLVVSNSAASAITLRMTGAASIRPLGSGTTNGLVIGSGKVGVFSALGMGVLITNYVTSAQQ